MKCFYHGADCDGRLSAYLVYIYAEINDCYHVEFIPINYVKEFPFESINQSETVYIVDYSIFPEEMEKLLSITVYCDILNIVIVLSVGPCCLPILFTAT